MPLSRVTGRQIKAGRALLGWKRDELAARGGVKAADVKAVETDETLHDALSGDARLSLRERLAATLESAGIEFTNGGALGVVLRPKSQGLKAADLNASNDD